MRLDLHIHTTASDGSWTPGQVVEGAVAGGLDVIAVTDHDGVSGVEEASGAAFGRGLVVVAGTELSSTYAGRELHVLGYFVDPEAPALLRHHRRAHDLRRSRLERMVRRLRTEGVHVAMDAVVAAAGSDAAMLARPHLARALVEKGLVGSVPEAFDRYLGDHRPAFIPTELQDPFDAVRLILQSGGLPVWAHPPLDLLEELLPGLVESGLRGLEVFRPSTSFAAETRLRRAAREAGLLLSGGSDWHDPRRNEPLGSFYVTARHVYALLAEGGL